MMANPAQDHDPDQWPDPAAIPLIEEKEWPPLDDEALAQIADETWLEYDAREAEQADRAEQPNQPGPPLDEMNDHE